MLQHDGHFFRVLLDQARGQPHTLRRRIEGDVKMVVAGQAFLRSVDQHAADESTQRFLGQNVVPDQVNSHEWKTKDRRRTTDQAYCCNLVICSLSSVLALRIQWRLL